MPRGNTPPSQRGRVIGWRGTTGSFDFVIRPEELTRYQPSRLALQQTLGGAWADCFGIGPIAIRLNGTTGWHGGPPDGGQPPGEDQFAQLEATVFTGWHAQRDLIMAGGGDPSIVTSIFVDTLDRTTDIVAPKSFTLKRHKQRPLFMMFTIEMLVLQPLALAGIAGGAGGITAALAGAQAALGTAAGLAQAAGNAILGAGSGIGAGQA
jgi:hypothetical protein